MVFYHYWYIQLLACTSLILIRTGGDYRLSNFLLWQSAYTELFFVKTLWPDFKYSNLVDITSKFYLRERKFGK